MIQPSTLSYLKKLARNNNKEWFDKHRTEYDAVKKNFELVVQEAVDRHSKIDPDLTGLEAKKCIFRINRDVRFSKDKTPYKTNLGASMSRGGKKSVFADYYMHIEPGKSFVGGGMWMPEAVDLRKVRQEIDYCWDEFNRIVSSPGFRKYYGTLYRSDGVEMTRVPQGFEKDNPAAAFLKLKHIIGIYEMPDEDVTSKGFINKVLNAYKALMPMVKFLNRALED
jgi:uncharacterized protein (TIGR02453 family)